MSQKNAVEETGNRVDRDGLRFRARQALGEHATENEISELVHRLRIEDALEKDRLARGTLHSIYRDF